MTQFATPAPAHRDHVLCVGMPGPLSKFAFELVLEAGALAQALGLADLRWVGPHDDVSAARDVNAPRQIFVTNSPGGALLDLIADGYLRTLFVMEDPLDSIAHERKMGLAKVADALRPIQATTAIALALRRSGKAAFMFRNPSLFARDVVSKALEDLSLKLSPKAVADLIDKFGGSAGEQLQLEQAIERGKQDHIPPQRRLVNLDDDLEALSITLAVDLLLRMAWGAPIEPVIWNSNLVVHESTLLPIGPGWIDLAGPPRSILVGPHVQLPPAQYRVTLVLDIGAQAIGVPLTIEARWGSSQGEVAFGRMITPIVAGPQQGSFDVILDRRDQALDLRLMLHTALLEGDLRFDRLEFLPLVE